MDRLKDVSATSSFAGTDPGASARLALALAKLRLATWDWDITGGDVVWNAEHFAILGLAPTPVVRYETFAARVHPDDLPQVEALLRRAMETRAEFHYEYRIVRADTGEVRLVEGHGVFFHDAAGTPVRGTGILRDVTEQRAAERAARASEARFRSVIETAGSVILALRPDHSIFEWNEAAARLFGVRREQALGRDYVRDFLAPEFHELVAADIRKVLSGTPTYGFEDDTIAADGRRVTLLWNVTRLVDADGHVEGIVAIGQDVTALKETERRFRALFEQSQDALFIYGRDGVEDCNAAAVRLLRAPSRTALLGRRLSELSPPMQGDGHSSEERNREIERVLEQQGSHRFDWLHQRFDGTTLPVEVSVTRIEVSGDERTLVAWHDLTERQEAAEALRRSEERLVFSQKLEALGQLAGGIAHDFNNLLTVMRSSVESAHEQVGPEHPAAADLLEAEAATERAARLTRQLLAFSRRQVLQPKTVDLDGVLADAERLLRRALTERIQLVLEPSRALPPVLADAGQLEQVLLNLVLNARDAMPPEGGTITLETSPMVLATAQDARFPGMPPGRYVQLAVGDTGSGIPPEVLPHIFEPFFTTKGPGQGTGLGLAVVYGIVRQSGGALHVDSAPGRGTTVYVLLPAAARDAATPHDAWPRVEEAEPFSALGRTVLLVEDEAPVRRTLARLLARTGYHVFQAQHGADALRLWRARRDQVDVVLTDVRMPEMDGRALAAALRAESPDVPIVFMSGYAHGTDDSGEPLGADELFVEKPATAEMLRAALRQAMERR